MTMISKLAKAVQGICIPKATVHWDIPDQGSGVSSVMTVEMAEHVVSTMNPIYGPRTHRVERIECETCGGDCGQC